MKFVFYIPLNLIHCQNIIFLVNASYISNERKIHMTKQDYIDAIVQYLTDSDDWVMLEFIHNLLNKTS